jgi:hypothetical protein
MLLPILTAERHWRDWSIVYHCSQINRSRLSSDCGSFRSFYTFMLDRIFSAVCQRLRCLAPHGRQGRKKPSILTVPRLAMHLV